MRGRRVYTTNDALRTFLHAWLLAIAVTIFCVSVPARAADGGAPPPNAALADAGAAATQGATAAPAPDEGDEVVDLSSEPDLVTNIGDAGAGTAAPAPAGAAPKTAPAPAKPDKFEFRGFTRLTVGAGVGSVANDPGGAPQERVPYDRGFAENHLYLDLHYARAKWFRAVASASLAFAGFYTENRPSSGAPTTSVDPQAFEAIPREGYVAFTLGRFDLRLGQQRIAWGNSDFFTPNDVLNGRDIRNPLMFDSEMLVLPSPAVRADFDMQFAVLSVVVEPFNVTDRFDIYGTNWSLVQADAPKSYRRLFGTLAQGQDRVTVAALRDALTGGQLSPAYASNGSAGGSLRMQAGGIDFSWYFLSGFDHTPAVYIDPAFQKQLESLDSTQLNGAVFEALQNQARASNTAIGGPILVSFRRRNHVGMDAQTSVGPLVLRTDLAYDSAKTFFSRDTMNAVIRPAVQGTVGLEYQTGSLDKFVGIEAWGMQILEPEILYVPTIDPARTASLLWYQDTNVAVAGTARWSFIEHTVVELRAQLGITPFTFLVRPEVGWESSSVSIRAGFLGLGGEPGSLGHYFRRNDTAYLTTRIAF